MKGFRSFILRGNVIDLAVGFVIGAAFAAIVKALVSDFITPLIAAIGGKSDFASLYFTVHNSRFGYGDFVNALVSFLVIAAVVYFLVVLPVNRLMARSVTEPEPVDETTQCTECLSKIPAAARRCAFCTAAQSVAGPGDELPAGQRS